MTPKIWHNGHIVDDKPILSAHDRLRLGEGVFSTMLAIDGNIMHTGEHFKKLLHSAEMFIDKWNPPSIEVLKQGATNLLKSNNQTKGRYAINAFITLGSACGGLLAPDKPNIQIIMRSAALPKEFPPLHAIISRSTRRNEHSPLSRIKGSFYGDNILAAREAKNKNANEAILLNTKGNAACFTIGNIVAIIDNNLITPPLSDGCQDGVTRGILIQKYNITERSITEADLKRAQGFYLLNSLRGAFPVSSLDGTDLPLPSIQIPKDFHLR